MNQTIYYRLCCLLLGFGLACCWPPSYLFAQAPKEAPSPTREAEPAYRETEIQRTDIVRPEKDPFKGKLSLSAEWFLDITQGRFGGSWHPEGAGGDSVSLTVPVKVNYKVMKDLLATVRVPLEVNWASSVNRVGPNGETSSSFGGVGDVSVILKYLLLNEGDIRPSITSYFSVDFPTGHSRALNPGRLGTDLLGDGAYNFIFGFNLFKEVGKWYFFSNLWYSIATSSPRDVEGPDTLWFHYRDQVIFNLAAEYNFTDQWGFVVEFYSLWDSGKIFGPRSNLPPVALVGILPEIDFEYNRNWTFSLGVAFDLAGKNTVYSYTPTFFAKYRF